MLLAALGADMGCHDVSVQTWLLLLEQDAAIQHMQLPSDPAQWTRSGSLGMGGNSICSVKLKPPAKKSLRFLSSHMQSGETMSWPLNSSSLSLHRPAAQSRLKWSTQIASC